MADITLSDGEKLILLLLCDIHQALKVRGEIDSEFIQSAIFSGNLWGLKWKMSGVFHDSEPTQEQITETVDVLDMWSFIESSYEKLSEADKERIAKEADPFGKYVKFPGFSGNEETYNLSIARFLIDQLGRFTNFKGRDLDSHFPSLDAYRRMLSVYMPLRNEIAHTGGLTADQLIAILKERTHPEKRRVVGQVN